MSKNGSGAGRSRGAGGRGHHAVLNSNPAAALSLSSSPARKTRAAISSSDRVSAMLSGELGAQSGQAMEIVSSTKESAQERAEQMALLRSLADQEFRQLTEEGGSEFSDPEAPDAEAVRRAESKTASAYAQKTISHYRGAACGMLTLLWFFRYQRMCLSVSLMQGVH